MKLITSFKWIVLVLILIHLLVHSSSFAQSGTHTKKSHNGLYYWEYLPPGYDPGDANTKYPLIIFLHGAGKRRVVTTDPAVRLQQLDKVLQEGIPLEIDKGHNMCFTVNGVQKCFIVLSPQDDEANFNWGDKPSVLMEHAWTYYDNKIDPARIYITGLSMGGRGTIDYIQSTTFFKAADIAAAAVAPGGGANIALTNECIVPRNDIAFWAVNGSNDTEGTPHEDMVDFVHEINECVLVPTPAPKAYLRVIEGARHNVWSAFYKTTNSIYSPTVYEWFLKNPKGASDSIPNQAPTVNAGPDAVVTGTTHTLSPKILADYDGTTAAHFEGISKVPNPNYRGSLASFKWEPAGGPSCTMSTNQSTGSLTVTNMNQPGTYIFKLSGTDPEGLTASDLVRIVKDGANIKPSVSITSPTNGQTFTEPATVTITANASDSDGTIDRVEFYQGSTRLGQDATAPFSYTWAGVLAGSYSITATAFDNEEGSTVSSAVSITVNTATTCTASGYITREMWRGVAGTNLSAIPLCTPPDETSELGIFEGPTNVADNYGSRIRGYICPPTTGNYIFWISSDDRSELWLSADDDPAKKEKIAEVTGWTGVRQWDKSITQMSAMAIHLTAGQKYFIEALHKEGSGGDHLAVGWQLPDGTLERPIAGHRLSPFINNAPTVSITAPTNGQVFTAPATVSIAATASDSDGTITRVEFFEGETNKLGEDSAAPYTFSWNNVPAGTYSLTARTTDNACAVTTSSAISITVNSAAACTASGQISREEWTNVPGTNVSDIPVGTAPSSTSQLTIFEGPTNLADNYGARIRGYICVPTTGNYMFWISSDDKSELWLSTDSNPANKKKIAYVSTWTAVREWTKSTNQQSSPIPLVAGQQYYIEALHKEGTGAGHIAVGWQLPGGGLERPIPGNRLSPFSNNSPSVSITSPSDGQVFSAPATISITAIGSDSDGSVDKVEFYEGGTNKIGEDFTAPYSLVWSAVSAGTYSLTAKAIDDAEAPTTSSAISITVNPSSACAGSGEITRDYWSGIPGTYVSAIPVDAPPTDTERLFLFEAPSRGDNYGARIRGYICVPLTGSYTFWISSDDRSELWLSADENPATKAKIATVDGWTAAREWTKYPTQKSAAVPLIAGHKYYIEALHKEGTGADHLAVGWQLPDGTLERPIPGLRLSPFTGGEMTWHSYDVEIGPEISEQGVVHSNLSSPAVVEFYESTDNFGVTKGALFPKYEPTNHPSTASHASSYWWDNTATSPYPFVALSTVGRGDDIGEGNFAQPEDVLDLQLHPPDNDHSTVAAFIVPFAGDYVISNLGARRVSSNGGTIRFKVFDNHKVLKADIQATNNQDWVRSTSNITLEDLSVNDRIYFATGRDGSYAWDFTEVSWTVTLIAGTSNTSGARTYSTTKTELITEVQLPETRETELALYPNPVEGTINVKGLLGIETLVKVYNMHGKLLFQEIISTHEGSLELQADHYGTGIYYMVLQSGGEKQVCKFLKL